MEARQHPLVALWEAFVAAFERRDDGACLVALREWILEWDRCFWERDFSAFGSIYSEDVEIRNSLGIVGVQSERGVAGFQRMRDDLSDVLAGRFRFDIEGFRRRGDDGFVGLGTVRAKGRYTGLVLRHELAIFWTLRGRRISRAEGFISHDRALAAAGLG